MTSNKLYRRAARLASTASLLLATSGYAIDWNGATGDYADGANWVGGVAPSETDAVAISSGQATNEGNLARSGETTISGTGGLVVNGRWLNGAGGPASTIIADSGTLSTTGNYFIIATGTHDSQMTQTGGEVNVTLDRGFFHSDNGTLGEGAGVYNALGGVLNVTLNSTDTGNNLHNYQAGRRGANDAFYVDGGDVNFEAVTENRRMYFTQDAVLQVDSGTYDASGFEYFVVGYGTSTGGGTREGTSHMYVNGGVTTISPTATGAMVVSDGQSGVVEVAGGQLTVNGPMIVGGDVTANNGTGSGSVLQTGGVLKITGDVAIGVAQQGNVAVSGGTFSAGSLSYGGVANSYFGLLGGSVVLDGDARSVTSEDWFAAPFGATAVYNAGADETTIAPDPTVQNLRLEVNTQTGEMTIVNPNSSWEFDIDYYEITSPSGALDATGWTSLNSQIPDGATPPAGDFSGDGVVDAADYTVWRDSEGQSVTPGTGADANSDGLVNDADLDLWKSNYGGTGVGSGWTEAGGVDGSMLAEYVLDADGYAVAGDAAFSLGQSFDPAQFGPGNEGDLSFSFEMANGFLVTGEVVYTGVGAATASAPEPTAMSLLIVLAAGAARRRATR